MMKLRLMSFMLAILGIFCIGSVMATEQDKFEMPENPIIVMETNQGTVEFALKPAIAPKACENMIRLAENKYYDGTTFHRVIKEFMIQGGDPQGTGRGGQSVWGKPFDDECVSEISFAKPGLLAMANAGPGTNGSQFFITTVETPWLHMRHTIFGEVVKGYDIVKKIEKTATDGFDRPVSPQTIQRMYLKKGE